MSQINVDKIVDSSGGVLAPISSVMRNRIINGAMVIDQRNAGASVTIPAAIGVYTTDRWAFQASQASKLTAQQNAGSVTPPVGFSNYLGYTVGAAANVTLGTNDYFNPYHRIEGFNTSDLGWGTANAQAITLSFWVRSSLTGTFSGALQNSGSTRSYPFTYTISAANTWEQKSITVAGDTTGTWVGATNGIGISIFFSLGSSSAFLGTANAWAAAGLVGATGSVNLITTNNATFYITGVQLERGTQATSFEYRQYTTELQLCQRYYYQSWGNGAPNATGNNATGLAISNVLTGAICAATFPVSMRSGPTVTLFDDTGATGTSSQPGYANGYITTAANISINGFRAMNSTTSYVVSTPVTAQFSAAIEL
jgi:hypothetical protein